MKIGFFWFELVNWVDFLLLFKAKAKGREAMLSVLNSLSVSDLSSLKLISSILPILTGGKQENSVYLSVIVY